MSQLSNWRHLWTNKFGSIFYDIFFANWIFCFDVTNVKLWWCRSSFYFENQKKNGKKNLALPKIRTCVNHCLGIPNWKKSNSWRIEKMKLNKNIAKMQNDPFDITSLRKVSLIKYNQLNNSNYYWTMNWSFEFVYKFHRIHRLFFFLNFSSQNSSKWNNIYIVKSTMHMHVCKQ